MRQPWAEDSEVTAGAPAGLIVTRDLRADGEGRSPAFVQVAVADARSNPVATANLPLRFSVTGPATIVATDNGDPTDYTMFSSQERRTFSGRAQAIVRFEPNTSVAVTIQVFSEGLPTEELRLS